MENKDIICVILVMLIFYLAMYKKKTEGFTPGMLIGQIVRPFSNNPARFYR